MNECLLQSHILQFEMLLLPGKGNCFKLLQIKYRIIRSTFAGIFSYIHFLLDSWEKFLKLSLISFF
jgi:hypothetical protein